MSSVTELLSVGDLVPAIASSELEALTAQLSEVAGLSVYTRSITAAGRRLFFLGRRDSEKWLGIVSHSNMLGFDGDQRSVMLDQRPYALKLCPTNHTNAVALRDKLPFTAPTVLGLRKSVGLGDRLGLATPGHVRAVRRHSLAPIFAQQSIREMARTGRTPEEVLDDATWGVFQEGWRDGFGADADHLKTVHDIDRCVAAGFTFFTVDPGDHVDDAADTDPPATLETKVQALPWLVLDSSPANLRDRYLGRRFDPSTSPGPDQASGRGMGDFSLTFDEKTLLRAAAKYGRAVAHTAVMYRHLAERMGEQPFDFEMSVDETETPTSVLEHFFVASELRRLGVEWVSLAPRFVGRFEKGVDYVGDLTDFEQSFAQHMAVARHLGPYKLSLHSGSDKFSIYPIVAKHAGELVHLKTAGTSYLEALRAVAGIDPELFRNILAFARDRYTEDRATYHVSADAGRVPAPHQLPDEELASVLDQFDGRQVLHVTFGSVLMATDEAGGYRFRDRLLAALESDEEAYYAVLEAHFERHLAPFDG